MTSEPKFTFGQRLLLAVVPRVVWALLWVVSRTWRFEVIAEEGATPRPFGRGAGPEIVPPAQPSSSAAVSMAN
jgi:hypothetical protein